MQLYRNIEDISLLSQVVSLEDLRIQNLKTEGEKQLKELISRSHLQIQLMKKLFCFSQPPSCVIWLQLT